MWWLFSSAAWEAWNACWTDLSVPSIAAFMARPCATPAIAVARMAQRAFIWSCVVVSLMRSADVGAPPGRPEWAREAPWKSNCEISRAGPPGLGPSATAVSRGRGNSVSFRLLFTPVGSERPGTRARVSPKTRARGPCCSLTICMNFSAAGTSLGGMKVTLHHAIQGRFTSFTRAGPGAGAGAGPSAPTAPVSGTQFPCEHRLFTVRVPITKSAMPGTSLTNCITSASSSTAWWKMAAFTCPLSPATWMITSTLMEPGFSRIIMRQWSLGKWESGPVSTALRIASSNPSLWNSLAMSLS
mmetsp:Transcript_23213/g.69105  ORF Transcript_23213/g.69105 Transcript_23213/m.69105 type:complete len:299 (+) Transcript_23213:269-1165(+)